MGFGLGFKLEELMIKVVKVGHNLQIGKSCARPNQNGIASATKDELRCDFTNKCSRNERMELVVQTFDDCGLDGKLVMNRVDQKNVCEDEVGWLVLPIRDGGRKGQIVHIGHSIFGHDGWWRLGFRSKGQKSVYVK
jgi:hypothetical protein